MNWLVFHIVSGHAFFSGILLLCLAGLTSTHGWRIWRRFSGLAFVVGLLFVAISSTAIPVWYYGVMLGVSVVWFASQFKERWKRNASIAFCTAWLVAGMLELPYHALPKLERSANRGLTVIGDSVTAGVGGSETAETWPRILAREHQLQVQDISHVGETVATALKRAKSAGIASPVVLVEIGGNDILGTTSPTQFAKGLDRLLTYLTTTGDRQIVMFELPLPPFYHEYGRAQRKLAAKHGVLLVPKRVFLSVIAGGDSTLDTIHLTQAGHQRMSDAVWSLVKTAFE